jgi:eukaryotic-like serine/threonine-protein kinase
MSNLYIFGEFVLDPGRRTLFHADSPVSLTPKAFDLLVFLVQNPNRLVTREELLQAVWGDTVVEEANLTQYISLVRKALGDNGEDTRFIATITRKGYQFARDVVSRSEAVPADPAAAQVNGAAGLREEPSHSLNVSTTQVVTDTTGPRRKPVAMVSAIFRWALPIGALLAVGAIGASRYEGYRHRITLAPTDTIVLADIDNRTSEPVFDDALNNALRYELEQTPYLNLLGLDKTYNTIGQLKIPPNTKLTPAIARQICTKTNSKLVITGSIADAGNQYRLEIRAVDCTSGATAAEEETVVSAREQVIHELGETGARFRRKLGEPAKSLARFNQPLEIATSASLEALQTGAQGTKLFLAGDPQTALPMYQRGIELDPDLALTYEGIGAANEILGDYKSENAAYTRAFQLRARMTEKDRLNTEYLYYAMVTGEFEKALSTLHQALELFPRDVFFHANLAYTLGRLGQPESSAEEEDETARLEPSPLYFSWAAANNIYAGRLNQAKAWLAEAKASHFGSLQLSSQEYLLAFIEGDKAALDQIFEAERHGPNRASFLAQKATIEASRGRLELADRLLKEASTLDPELTSEALVFSALQDAEACRSRQARMAEDQALRRKLDRNRKMILALALARSGRSEESARLAREVSQEAPLDTTVNYYLVPTVRAAIQLNEHDPAAAIDTLRGTVQYDLAHTESFNFLYPAYIRGLAYLELGDGGSAAREFQKLTGNPGISWRLTGPFARIQLARAERLVGDNESARQYYREFLTIWKDADPDLLIYRQAKAEYAQLKKS